MRSRLSSALMATPMMLLGSSIGETTYSKSFPATRSETINRRQCTKPSIPKSIWLHKREGATDHAFASSTALPIGRLPIDTSVSADSGYSSAVIHKNSGQNVKSSLPVTVEDLQDVIAANTPVFHLHHDEEYFPCTVEFFLKHAKLCTMRNKMFMQRIIEREIVPYGELDEDSLINAYRKNRSQRLQLHLQKDVRSGQESQLQDIPVYVHVRETVDFSGQRDAIEIVYCKFFAFNGPYKPFGIIPSKTLGAHDADWEHVTVRLTAGRHIDGTWCSADEVPRTADGRPHAYIAINGHGSYPVPGRIIRLFGIFNDNTSADGKVWDPKSAVIVSPSGKLPSVLSRGDSLNGTAYPSTSVAATGAENGFVSSNPMTASSPRQEVHTVLQPNPPWLQYGGKWGSTVVAPALQEWFAGAENPVSRTWLQTVFFPLVPGVDSLLEPLVEEAEDLQLYVLDQMDDLQTSAGKGSADAIRQLETYKERIQVFFDDMTSRPQSSGSTSRKDSGTDVDARTKRTAESNSKDK